MEELLKNIKIQVSDKLYLQNPDSKVLGKLIIQHSINLIDEIGYEAFTFKKLGVKIGSPESTIYRYFKNKKQLLIYITSWYWGWVECRLIFFTNNIISPQKRLELAIKIITESVKKHAGYPYIDEIKLNRVIISESLKAIHSKEVNEGSCEIYFQAYNKVVERISGIILDVSPGFEYSHTMVTTIIEGVHFQKFYSSHVPVLADIRGGDEKLVNFFTRMAFSMLNNGEYQNK